MNRCASAWLQETCTSHVGAKVASTVATSAASALPEGTTTASRRLSLSKRGLFFSAQRTQRATTATLGTGQARRSHSVWKARFWFIRSSVAASTAVTSSSETLTAPSCAAMWSSRSWERVTRAQLEAYSCSGPTPSGRALTAAILAHAPRQRARRQSV